MKLVLFLLLLTTALAGCALPPAPPLLPAVRLIRAPLAAASRDNQQAVALVRIFSPANVASKKPRLTAVLVDQAAQLHAVASAVVIADRQAGHADRAAAASRAEIARLQAQLRRVRHDSLVRLLTIGCGLGALALATGVALFFLAPEEHSIAIALIACGVALGAACAALIQYPWLLLLAAGLAALVTAAALIWEIIKHRAAAKQAVAGNIKAGSLADKIKRRVA